MLYKGFGIMILKKNINKSVKFFLMFITNFIFSIGLPCKGYVHEAGISLFEDVDFVRGYMQRILLGDEVLLSRFSWVIAVAWGNVAEKCRTIDCFCFRNYGNWPGNPDVHVWNYDHGIIRRPNPLLAPQFCGDIEIMLGKEEDLRRGCRNLREYVSRFPDLGGLMRK
jgi:hypothetical protein